MAFVRDWFTGELVERPACEPGIIARTTVPESAPRKRGISGDMWRNHVCKAMCIPAEQATPERIARENAEAKRNGTGAVYDANGKCHLPTRRSRALEGRRRGYQDNEAGYGDYAGR